MTEWSKNVRPGTYYVGPAPARWHGLPMLNFVGFDAPENKVNRSARRCRIKTVRFHSDQLMTNVFERQD